jgi:hypothetical protein
MWVIWSLFAVGCGDPVRTTVQLVSLRLVDSRSSQPIAGAQLLLKEAFEAGEPRPEAGLTPEEWRHYKSNWDRFPWFRGDSNEDGKASIVVEYTVRDRSKGAKLLAWRDWVTGKRFLVRVKKGQSPSVLTKADESPEEKVSLWMEPGESVRGRTVAVTVLEIQEPWYVETK